MNEVVEHPYDAPLEIVETAEEIGQAPEVFAAKETAIALTVKSRR